MFGGFAARNETSSARSLSAMAPAASRRLAHRRQPRPAGTRWQRINPSQALPARNETPSGGVLLNRDGRLTNFQYLSAVVRVH